MTLILKTDHTIVKFNKDSKLFDWRVVDDVVMGGKSNGSISINEEGNAVFKGTVSLENNGGFSSLRHRFETLNVSNFKMIKIRLKGDGRKYQFRVKTSKFDQQAYIHEFSTNNEWQLIQLQLSKFEPRFRGRKLNMSNFPGETMEELSFLIGNKKNEKFQLIIDSISLE
jgi:NADH dehydrogenase [ubiquinone] 1 alpha subcomplex assembly factor 1